MQVVSGIPYVSPVVLIHDARVGVCRVPVISGEGHPPGGGRVDRRSLWSGQIDAGVDHRPVGGESLAGGVEIAKLWYTHEMLGERVAPVRQGPDANTARFTLTGPFVRRLVPFLNGP